MFHAKFQTQTNTKQSKSPYGYRHFLSFPFKKQSTEKLIKELSLFPADPVYQYDPLEQLHRFKFSFKRIIKKQIH